MMAFTSEGRMKLFTAISTALIVAGLAMPAHAASEKMEKKVTKTVKAKKAAPIQIVNVRLWDKNMASVDMSKPMGLGLGMNGDMSMAPMGVTADKTTVKAGVVMFEVTNTSMDTVHEMIVAPISDVNETLPYLTKDNIVDEDHGSHLGEVSELEPGKNGALRITLKPGKYILYCNIPMHYMDGMWTLIEAK
jgi:uncharacterized cupredoxin-like copper-binding protein